MKKKITLYCWLLCFPVFSGAQLITATDAGIGWSFTDVMEDQDPRQYIVPRTVNKFSAAVSVGYAFNRRARVYLGLVTSNYGMLVSLSPEATSPHQSADFYYSMGTQYRLQVRGEYTLLVSGKVHLSGSLMVGGYCNTCSSDPFYIPHNLTYPYWNQGSVVQANGWESTYNAAKVPVYGLGLAATLDVFKQQHFLVLRADYTQAATWNYRHKVIYREYSAGGNPYSGAYKVLRNNGRLLLVTLGYAYTFPARAK